MSLGSSTRSAAQATSSALDRIPIRWRLAGGSAILTLIILCAFAVAVGTLTTQRIYDDFDREVRQEADELRGDANIDPDQITGTLRFRPNLKARFGSDEAARLVDARGNVYKTGEVAADLGPPVAPSVEYKGWRVENRPLGPFYLQYGRPIANVQATVRRVRLFLVGGVVGGAGLALLAGLMIARRAMRPIAALTETAREIERTRDPSRQITPPPADDEIAELATTMDGMLRALAEARGEQEAMLLRQREFVADASHELRTPLTSVLANLDFLAETLDGEQGEAAHSALRSSHRMRRLVQDLLLLARADARRRAPHQPVDLRAVVVEAAAELEPVVAGHTLTIDAHPAVVDGVADELHRLALNLMENAIRHTPHGTVVRASVGRHGDVVRFTVEDDGPGIPASLQERVFERFVRGEGDRGGSFGLGLSIVRAVADSHGGKVDLDSEDGRGTRFTVTLPAAPTAVPSPPEPAGTPA